MSESTSSLPPSFSCPVCEEAISFIWVWQQPDSDRVRIFCEDCSRRPEYRALAREERTILNEQGFQRFAARRMLSHVLEKERRRRASLDEPGAG